MTGNVIETNGLTKAFSGRLAVEDVSLSIGPGVVFGFVGPNGAGKTTTIRLLLGLVTPTRGEIRLFGEDTAPDVATRRRVGAMVERPAFYPHLSAMDNLRVFATIRRNAAAVTDVRETLSVVGLDQAMDRAVRHYSAGMKQRLALALALLGRPPLVVLDEPTDGLDPMGIVDVRRIIASLASGGTTVFLSSHLLTEVERVCTQVAFLFAGRIVQQGAPHDLVGAGSQLSLTFDEPGQAAEAMDLLHLAGYQARAAERPVDVDVDASPSSAGEVFRVLDQAGLVASRIGTRTRSLEQQFLEMTKTTEPPA